VITRISGIDGLDIELRSLAIRLRGSVFDFKTARKSYVLGGNDSLENGGNPWGAGRTN
jgi:hypothetical protein